MRVKKSGGKVYGAELTAAEKRALDMEARRHLAEYTRLHEVEIEALVIRQLKRFTDWPVEKLREFYDGFDGELMRLVDYYEMDEVDAPWLCTRELLREGVDISEWHRQRWPNERYEV